MRTVKGCPFCGAAGEIKPMIHDLDCYMSMIKIKNNHPIALDMAWNQRSMPRQAEGILRDLDAGSISVADALELLEAAK